jgi:hypothetical protein
MTSMISIKAEDPNSPDALALMEELSESLQLITGDSGRNSFDVKDVCVPRSVFIIARNLDGDADCS